MITGSWGETYFDAIEWKKGRQWYPRRIRVGSKWIKSPYYEDNGVGTSTCRNVFIIPEKEAVIKFGVDPDYGTPQNEAEWEFYTNTLEEDHKGLFPKLLDFKEICRKSQEEYLEANYTVHQYVNIDRNKDILESQQEELEDLIEYYKLEDVHPDERGESTTDTDANVGIDKEGRLWILDYGMT